MKTDRNIIVGKNTDYVAMFNANTQSYNVFYKGKLLISNKYKFSEIVSYFN